MISFLFFFFFDGFQGLLGYFMLIIGFFMAVLYIIWP